MLVISETVPQKSGAPVPSRRDWWLANIGFPRTLFANEHLERFWSRLDEAREIVSRTGWLAQRPQPFRDAVLSAVKLERLEPDATLYLAGDETGGIYGLVSGSLRVSLAPGDQGSYHAHFFRPGFWFGEAPLISGGPRIVGMSVATQTDVLYLPLNAISEILRRDPTAWRAFASLTLGHLQVAMGVVADLMIRDHTQRLVAVLLRLAVGQPWAGMSAEPCEIDISQEELAVMANVGRTKASSILNRLEAEGHVALAYRRITIVNAHRLRASIAW